MARNPRRRDDDDRDDPREEARPRRRKKKAKGTRGVVVVLVLLLGAALVGGGVFLIISLNSGGKAALEDDTDRILGNWQGTAPDHPTMTLSLQVFPKRIVFGASDARTGRGKDATFARRSDRTTGKGLVLVLEGPDRPFEWSITFKSNDEMTVQSLTDPDSPPRHYKRLGK